VTDKKKQDFEFTFSAQKIPTDAGCYLFLDGEGEVLYVGKAKNLRKRVRSYFQKTDKSPKTASLVKKIRAIETRIVSSETEALILENNLIKELQPRYNILLRDDKNFLYLRITNELFPRLEITRRIVRDGSFYLGPKTSAKKFRATIAFCQKIFQIRTCRLDFDKCGGIAKNPEKRKIPCLDFHIKKCSGPCDAQISPENYRAEIDRMKKFLRGDTREVLQNLKEKMMEFATAKNFESAAKMRDLIQSIESSTQRQTVQFSDLVARDFVHFFRDGRSAFFVRLVFRNGKFLDQNEVEFHAEKFESDAELIEKFLQQFYERVDEMPAEIFIPEKLENAEQISEILKTELKIPQRGEKRKVLQLARKNAEKFCETKKLESASQAENFASALPELAQILDLAEPPRRIECFDISHFAGQATVASQVVFFDGEPKKSQYRRFHLKSLPAGKIDDFAAMTEVLTRRFARTDDKKFAETLPNLIVIDGGKGQLSAVLKIFKNLKIPNFNPKKQIIALAKQEEEIFTPEKKDPLELDKNSAASKLLQRCRDEAHRFAITFNRSVRGKTATKSILDEIRGIGPATKKKLLKTFGSVSGIREASDEKLLEFVSAKTLQNLRKNL
jgi:excinuclease ABC subunit C